MPFSVIPKGQHLGTRADRIAVAHWPGGNPPVITLIWNGSDVKHTLWDLPPNGDLLPIEVNSEPGGAELSVAYFSATRVVSMHRSGSRAALKFEAWKTGGIFELSDDAVGPADRDPEIVPFGGDPGILPSLPASGVQPVSGLTAAQADRPTEEPEGTTPPVATRGGQTYVPAPTVGAKVGPKAGHAVVASITQSNHVRLALWSFDNGGHYKLPVAMQAEVDGGSATDVSAVKVKEYWTDGPRVTGAEVVTAARGGDYALKLQRWRISLGSQNTPASIKLMSEHTAAEKVSQVSAAPLQALSATQVATAVKLDDGTLKIIGWKMESGGGMTRWVDIGGAAINGVSAAQVRGRTIVTALREADGRLKTSYWRFPSAVSGPVEHLGNTVEGNVGLVRCTHVPGTGTHLGDTVVATQSQDGKLQLFRYRVTE